MAIFGKNFGLKGKLQDAVKSTREAVGKVDLSGVKDKIQETGAAAKEAVKKAKMPEIDASKIKKTFRKNEPYTIVQLSGTKIRILLPEGYERMKYKNPLKDAAKSIANADAAYRKTVGTSDDLIMFFKTTPDKAMNPDDLQGLIDGIHRHMSDSQGIIEAKAGETKRGYRYIYSIVKNLLSEQFGGVRYFLRLNLFDDKEIIEVQADFTEIGITGEREAICLDLAKRAGLADVFADGYKDWAKDPYDPEYTRGVRKNLAEKEGLDGMFPENPLSQAHEFLIAVLKDELVVVRHDDEEENGTSADNHTTDPGTELTAEERAEKEKELLLGLFVDECRRHTIQVDIEETKKNEVLKGNPAGEEEKPDQSTENDETGTLNISAVSTRNAIKIIYYLMAADGRIVQGEEEKFNAIGQELDPDFMEKRDHIIRECQAQLDKVIDPEDYYDTLQDGIDDALVHSKQTADTFITPKMLVWDLLTIAYSDECYDETERKLLKHIVRKANIDPTVFLEMESSILTLMDIERELSWIKTTNKPYLTIEAMVNELADRKSVIFESVKDLVML